MRITVGHISAHCEHCGCWDFQPSAADASATHELVCFDCGARTTRSTLLMQIADQTVRRAQAFLDLSKKARSEPHRGGGGAAT